MTFETNQTAIQAGSMVAAWALLPSNAAIVRGVLAKIITTLDVLSGGRAQLGLGASWYEREQRGLGVPVVPVTERFERLEETLRSHSEDRHISEFQRCS